MISLLLLSGWSLAFPLLHTWRLRPSPSTPASPRSAAAGSASSAVINLLIQKKKVVRNVTHKEPPWQAEIDLK